MDVGIWPEPPGEERAAIEAALAVLAARAAAADEGASAWWRAGVRENVCADEPEYQAAAVPRRRPGASRA